MVMLYEEYSSLVFIEKASSFLTKYFVQTKTAQLQTYDSQEEFPHLSEENLPLLISLTSFSNHIVILNQCNTTEKKLFYILYAHREHLKTRELQRCISNDTYTSLLGSKHKLSKGLLKTYQNAPILFKDKAFVDFLGLPQKHSEKKLRMGLVEHMKQFILELGKDFLFVDQEYSLEVGASVFKVDLLFFHRGLQALVAVELKLH